MKDFEQETYKVLYLTRIRRILKAVAAQYSESWGIKIRSTTEKLSVTEAEGELEDALKNAINFTLESIEKRLPEGQEIVESDFENGYNIAIRSIRSIIQSHKV